MLKLTVTVDNKSLKRDTKADWGFSLFVNLNGVRGLFDVGPSYETLLYNANKLGISLKNLDFIFISHMHSDHSGDLLKVVQALRPKHLFLPATVSYSELMNISKFISSVKTVAEWSELLPNIFSTGLLEAGYISEQSMFINLESCSVVLVGCSHGGIINILKLIRAKSPVPVLLLIGGLHISSYERGKTIGKSLLNMGIAHVYPCHCTKEEAKEGIYEAYGRSTPCGVGLTLSIDKTCSIEVLNGP